MTYVMEFSGSCLYDDPVMMRKLAVPDRISILPSPHVVLFPHTHLSLHISTLLYDQLRQGPPDDNFYLGLAFQKEGIAYHPTVMPLACAGIVLQALPLSCGKAVHLDLLGLKRIQVLEREMKHSFEPTMIEALSDRPGRLEDWRKKMLAQVLRAYHQDLGQRPVESRSMSAELADEALVNTLCLQSDLSPRDKYFLLEAEGINQRCSRLIDLLRFKLDDLRACGKSPLN